MREDAKLPLRAYHSDAGMDLFYCPNGERNYIISEEGLAIDPRDSKVIPTGIKVEVPYGHMLEIKNKSGIASKRMLITGACVVDPGYNGELFVNLHNIGLNTQYIKPGDKIAQAVLIPIIHCRVEEVINDNLNEGTLRGEGGFGSTGTK
jgi:dUTP pyrophosphatase